jgi:hypothetical protein
MVKLLLEAGADVNAQSEEYGSVLREALFKDSKHAVKLLFELADFTSRSRMEG